MNVEQAGRRVTRAIRSRVDDRRHRPPVLTAGVHDDPGTVYYLTPDFDQPSGGIRAMYRHVDLLNDHGIPAVVLHTRRGFRCSWFDHETPTTDIGRVRVASQDLVVLPEVFGTALRLLPPGVRHVIFNQSGHLTWDRDADGVTRHYRTSTDLRCVMTVSDSSASLLRYAFPDTPVARVHLGIDPSVFHPGAASRARRISYLPRRGMRETEQVLHILRSRGALAGWETRPLDGLSPTELAEELRQSTLFLNLSGQEGFGLPAAEAMACGNYVLGFHGFGGREFFRPEFSHPVETGDVVALAQAVADAIEREERDPGWCAARGALAAAHIAREYNPLREQHDVVELIAAALSRDPAAAMSRTG